MGSGITQVAAQSGYPTILYELNGEVLEKAKISINKNLQYLVDKGKISPEEKTGCLQRITFTNDLHNCIADIFIEAIIEKPEIKLALFSQLAELNHSECIFASNTSSLSITKIAEKFRFPGRVIGMHFFNPAPQMKLVEVVKTPMTEQEVTQSITELARKFGKTPVLCKDSPGFIVNRVARPFYIESLRLAEEHAGFAPGYDPGFAQIDEIMEASGFKMGPFKLMDLIGNDVNYAVSCSVYEQLNYPERLKPSYLQEQNVKQGKLGKKSGQGYYTYS